MSKRTVEKIAEFTQAQLEVRLKELLKEYQDIRFNRVVGTVDDPSNIKHIRKNIARIKTVLKEYELGISTHDGAYRIRKNQKIENLSHRGKGDNE